MGMITTERFMSDEDIEASYRDHKITETHVYGPNSGAFQIELPYNEDRFDNWVIYEDGTVAFDHWYPQALYWTLADKAREALKNYEIYGQTTTHHHSEEGSA